LEAADLDLLDAYAAGRLRDMCERYADYIARTRARIERPESPG